MFGFLKGKKKDTDEVLKQDLTDQQMTDSVFVIHLFFENKVCMPSNESIMNNLSARLGKIESASYNEKMASYATLDYVAEFKDGKVPVMLSILECISTDEFQVDRVTLSQFWDCPESEEILSNCKYHVVAVDMMGAGIVDYKKRAKLLCEYAEALVDLFPECRAILFQNSGKMYSADDFKTLDVPEDIRFIKYAVNVRFFNIDGTNDKMVDSLGMRVLNLPDVQYHFRDMEPNWVVEHAYNVCSYNYDHDAPIQSGQTIDGIKNGSMEKSIQWQCQYEDALIQPVRLVMDIDMKEYAAGQRG